MKPIDFLNVPGASAGVRPCPGGFAVDEPWGEYRLGEFELNEGWYEFCTDAAGAVIVLYDQMRFNLVELQASHAVPAYVRLSGGQYSLSIMPGARPGFHPTTVAEFRALSSWRRGRLLGGRLLHALRDGVSLPRIVALIRLALSRQTYGVRAQGSSAGLGLGVLTAADRTRDLSDPSLGNYTRRLNALTDGPRFLIQEQNGVALEPERFFSQIYRNYTLDPAATHDFVVTLASNDTLTPDALLLFAECIFRQRDAKVILADKWIDGRPTARVAWDPLLYDGGLPSPLAYARGEAPVASFTNRAAFSLIPIPLASSGSPEIFKSYPVSIPLDMPPCSIIIPTRDRADLLAACLEGLFERTAWPHEVIVVDNGSIEPETFALFDRYSSKGLKVIRVDLPFNFSTLSNIGAEIAAHEYLVFLNNDVVLHRSDWLGQMMAFAVLPEAGAVGARLLYKDGRLQHGGVMLGLTQLCGHLWRGLSRDFQDLEPQLAHASLRSAVTAACLCLSRAKFDAVGGFDANRFPVTLNDVDLCRKLLNRGWFNIYCAQAEAYHLEGESRGSDDQPVFSARRQAELNQFDTIWDAKTQCDQWMSLTYSRATERLQFL